MPVVADFPGLYEKIRAYADTMARSMNVDPKEIYAFFNNRGGHFPQNIGELNSFLDEVDPKYGVSRRDPTTGAVRFFGGGQRTPGKTDQDLGGFPGHQMNNAEDFDIERFQQVDPRGTVFGGSFDPQFNAAHPELAGKSGFDTPLGQSAGLANLPVQSTGRGPTMGLASAGVGPTPQDIQNAADQPPTSRRQIEDSNGWPAGSLGGDTAPAQPGAGGGGSAGAGVGGGTSGSSNDVGTNIGANDSLARAVEAAGTLAYNYAKLELERQTEAHRSAAEIERLAQAAKAQAAKEVQDRAVATGRYPDGTPTLTGRTTDADLTGYDPGSSVTARAAAAINALPPEGRTGAAAAAIWQNLVPGMTAEQAQAMNEAGHQYYAATGTTMPEDVARQRLGQITGRPASSFGTLTPNAQHLQNQDTTSILTLLSSLRGPENAFAYANTLANVPESIRAQVQAAMGRLPVQSPNSAQQGVLGDLGVQQPGAAVPPSHAASAQPTAQGGNAMAAAPGVIGQTFPQMMPGTAVPRPVLTQAQPTQTAGNATGAAPGMRQALGQQADPNAALQQHLAVMPVRSGLTPGQPPAMLDPSQLSPTDMARTPTYMRNLLWAGYEAHGGPGGTGMDINDVKDRYLRSLPVASGPRRGTYRAA